MLSISSKKNEKSNVNPEDLEKVQRALSTDDKKEMNLIGKV